VPTSFLGRIPLAGNWTNNAWSKLSLLPSLATFHADSHDFVIHTLFQSQTIAFQRPVRIWHARLAVMLIFFHDVLLFLQGRSLHFWYEILAAERRAVSQEPIIMERVKRTLKELAMQKGYLVAEHAI
jgi:hypothetical protein